MELIVSASRRVDAPRKGGAEAAVAVDAQVFDVTKNNDLRFWQHSATLHDIEADLAGCSTDEQFKDAVLRDYDSWIVSSALLATVGFGSSYEMQGQVTDLLPQDGKRGWLVQVSDQIPKHTVSLGRERTEPRPTMGCHTSMLDF